MNARIHHVQRQRAKMKNFWKLSGASARVGRCGGNGRS